MAEIGFSGFCLYSFFCLRNLGIWEFLRLSYSLILTPKGMSVALQSLIP